MMVLSIPAQFVAFKLKDRILFGDIRKPKPIYESVTVSKKHELLKCGGWGRPGYFYQVCHFIKHFSTHCTFEAGAGEGKNCISAQMGQKV